MRQDDGEHPVGLAILLDDGPRGGITMPEETPEGGAGTALAENEEIVGRSASSDAGPTGDGPGGPSYDKGKTFTQEDVDRIVTERLRRERQRTEKAVRDEFEARIAELEGSQGEARQARTEMEALSGALKSAETRALIAERLLAKGVSLPPPYLALVKGDDLEGIDGAIEAAKEQWASDMRRFARPPTDIGAPTKPGTAALVSRPTRVDEVLAERMRHGDHEAFREYQSMRR